jgi:hypothetical protein
MNEIIHIHLNSSNAIRYYNANYLSQVEFIFPQLDIPSEYTIYLSVCHASIPYSFYNINGSNNILKYSISSQIFTVTIPVGNYTSNNLLTVLQALLSVNNFTVSYSGITNQFTFTNSNFDFTFIYDPQSIQSTCFGLLGFSLTYQYSSNKKLTSDTMLNLCPTRCLCISSSFRTANIQTISLNNNSILCSIPINVNPYATITYQNPGYKTNLNSNIFNSVILNIKDQDGNYINFNSIHWSITLQLEIVNYVV